MRAFASWRQRGLTAAPALPWNPGGRCRVEVSRCCADAAQGGWALAKFVFVFLDAEGTVINSAIEDCVDEADMRERARLLGHSFHGVEVWSGGRRIHADEGGRAVRVSASKVIDGGRPRSGAGDDQDHRNHG